MRIFKASSALLTFNEVLMLAQLDFVLLFLLLRLTFPVPPDYRISS